jgi:hypothetical protein
MNTSISREKMNKYQIFNLSTNILTVVLFIIFSIVKRIETNSLIVYVLIFMFAINALASIVLLYFNQVLRPPNYSKNGLWILLRIAANIAFALLSYSLLV